jgi:predicted amidohydrolase YtcJ
MTVHAETDAKDEDMQSADLVLKSDAVFTGAEGSVLAGGVAVKGNRIAAVGTARELESWIGARTTVREFGDRLIMPGIIDAHMHFFAGAFSSSPYMLMDLFEAHSEKESAAMVEKFAKEHPDYDRIAGMGWCQAYGHQGLPFPIGPPLTP